MSEQTKKITALVVGGGPAGLSAAIRLKYQRPDATVCVVEKAAGLGNHNLSGAVLEAHALEMLLDPVVPGWADGEESREVLGSKVEKDKIMFLLGSKIGIDIRFGMEIAKALRLGPGQMIHDGDYSVSICRLTRWLGEIAAKLGVEVMPGFSAEDVILNDDNTRVVGIKLVDQGLDRDGYQQPNFVEGETVEADFFVLSEGCDGLVTEKLVEKAGLERKQKQLFSVGVKELIKVNPGQYERFTKGCVVHALGYPLWRPVIGPAMFGGGIVYAGLKDHLSVGMIVGADWKYRNFNPQDALNQFKQHSFVRQYIDGGTLVEAGAKMIPEGGYFAIPRNKKSGAIGVGNCMILGDSAGFVNMLKIKGLHNAIISGVLAADAICDNLTTPCSAAAAYTTSIEISSIGKEMRSASKFRQTIAKFGMLFGMPLSAFGRLIPRFNIASDYKHMSMKEYTLKPEQQYDKDTFTAMAGTKHREDEPCHLIIGDENICKEKCEPKFGRPCVTFCPAGVYESVGGVLKAANPANCVHCKTCQRKCPFDNIRWTAPEGGGPRYRRL